MTYDQRAAWITAGSMLVSRRCLTVHDVKAIILMKSGHAQALNATPNWEPFEATADDAVDILAAIIKQVQK